MVVWPAFVVSSLGGSPKLGRHFVRLAIYEAALHRSRLPRVVRICSVFCRLLTPSTVGRFFADAGAHLVADFSNINLTPLRLSLGSVSVRTRVLLSSTLSASSPAWLAAFCFEALAFSERSMLRKSFSSCWLAVALVNYNVVSNF